MQVLYHFHLYKNYYKRIDFLTVFATGMKKLSDIILANLIWTKADKSYQSCQKLANSDRQLLQTLFLIYVIAKAHSVYALVRGSDQYSYTT